MALDVDVSESVAVIPVPIIAVSGQKPLKRLKMKHRRVVGLHLQGLSNIQIAAALGLSAGSVSCILNNPTCQEILERAFRECDRELRALYPSVVGRIREILDAGSDGDALGAIDRFAKLTGRYREAEEKQATAEDVVRRILKVRQENTDGSVQEVTVAEERT